MMDSWGDGWSGGTIKITCADGDVALAETTLESGSSQVVTFVIGPASPPSPPPFERRCDVLPEGEAPSLPKVSSNVRIELPDQELPVQEPDRPSSNGSSGFWIESKMLRIIVLKTSMIIIPSNP